MKITDIRATTVTVPLEAPLRHANGCHWGRFVRTIVEVETDNGLIGLGEMGGGGESAEAVFRAMKSYLVGHDPARLEEMRFLIANPTASLYNNRTQVLAALEFACLDILGQAWGVPVCDILGGRLRDRVPFATYCFFRYPTPKTGAGEVRTIDQLVAYAGAMKRRFGFTTHKMKAGVFPPDYELEAYRALAAAFPGDSLRFDPNGVWSTEQAIRFGQAIEGVRNDYLEDPVFGLNGMRRTRQMVRVPLATNTVVVNFEQLAANALDTAVDVILLDTTFWGGIRACVKAAGVCETFQLGVAVHSSGELGIQLATMLHLGAVIPNLSFAADAHYHHLIDDMIEGGLMRYENGSIAVPKAPGLGVRLDREKVRAVQRTVPAAGRLSVRPGSGAPRLDADRPQRPLGRSFRRPRGFHPGVRLMRYFLFVVLAASLHGETGYEAWLRYAPTGRAAYEASVPAVAARLGEAATVRSAQQELIRGVRGMLGRTLRDEARMPQESAIVLGTLAEIRQAAPQWGMSAEIPPDGYWLKTIAAGSLRYTVVAGGSDRGVLYGAFALLRKIALGEPVVESRRAAGALRAGTVGQPVGQPGWLDRARLRRPFHLLGERAGSR